MPSCSLKKLDLTKEQLLERHLVLVNIKCENMPDVSANCKASQSHITYKCIPGFKFETNQDIFKSKCSYNKWEEVPKCIPGKNY